MSFSFLLNLVFWIIVDSHLIRNNAKRFPCNPLASFLQHKYLAKLWDTQNIDVNIFHLLLQISPVLLHMCAHVCVHVIWVRFYYVCRSVHLLTTVKVIITGSLFTRVFILLFSPSNPRQPLTCPLLHNSVISKVLHKWNNIVGNLLGLVLFTQDNSLEDRLIVIPSFGR